MEHVLQPRYQSLYASVTLLPGTIVTIGTSTECTVVLPKVQYRSKNDWMDIREAAHPEMSNVHCELHVDAAGGVTLVNRSTSATFINFAHRRITVSGSRELAVGSSIRFVRRNWLEEAYPDEDEDEDEEAEIRADDWEHIWDISYQLVSKPRASPLVEAKPHLKPLRELATLQFLSTVSNGNPQELINVLSSLPLASVVVPRLEPGMLAAAYDAACARGCDGLLPLLRAELIALQEPRAWIEVLRCGSSYAAALVLPMVLSNASKLWACEDVPSLPLITLIAILSSDELACYGREESVLEMALAWLLPKSRAECMSAAPHLRKTIRWSELDKDTVRAIMFLPPPELFPDVSLVAATDTDEVWTPSSKEALEESMELNISSPNRKQPWKPVSRTFWFSVEMDIDTFELEDALHDARTVYDLTTIGNGLFCGVYELRMDADLTTVRKLIDGGVGHHWMFDSVHYKELNMWGERFFSCRDSYSPSSWDVFNRFEGAIYEIPEQCTSRASQRAQEASKWLPELRMRSEAVRGKERQRWVLD